jgi:N-acetylmuramoyl-L-alanine amidase
MGNTYLKISPLSLVVFFAFLFLSGPVSAALITDVRFWSAPDHTRVVLDLTEPIQYESSSQANPAQLQLEMRETILLTRKRELGVNDSFLSKISLTPLGEKKVRLILHQKRQLQANILTLKPYQDKPHRIVIQSKRKRNKKRDKSRRRPALKGQGLSSSILATVVRIPERLDPERPWRRTLC